MKTFDVLSKPIKKHLPYFLIHGISREAYHLNHCGHDTAVRNNESCFFKQGTELRLVGFCDQITKRLIDHQGWFVDEYQNQGTIRGLVYRLPARKGKELFIVGYYWNENDSYVLCYDKVYDDVNDAAYAADDKAKNYSKIIREDNLKFDAEQRIETLLEKMQSYREDFRDTAKIIRTIGCNRILIKIIKEARSNFKDRLRGVIELRDNYRMILEWKH